MRSANRCACNSLVQLRVARTAMRPSTRVRFAHSQTATTTAPVHQKDAVAPPLIFRQLFDSDSSTYTYLLADAVAGEAILIDPVLEKVERDLKVIEELGVRLVFGINTHAHADHVTGTGKIKQQRPGVKSAISKGSGAAADVKLVHGDVVRFGSLELEVRATPGHTNGCVSYYLPSHGMVFTGDALLIRGCGRTDFQEGSATQLYESVHSQLFTLPGDTIVYPAHDYKGCTASSVAEERAHNPRLTKPLPEFVAIMDGLNLPRPKQIDRAVPANLKCGVFDEE